METILDNCYEVLLKNISYDGKLLVAKVTELYIGERKKIVPKPSGKEFMIQFSEPVSFCVVEEIHASITGLTNDGAGKILRDSSSTKLSDALGLGEYPERSNEFRQYCLITAHEILVVFTSNSPIVTELK